MVAGSTTTSLHALQSADSTAEQTGAGRQAGSEAFESDVECTPTSLLQLEIPHIYLYGNIDHTNYRGNILPSCMLSYVKPHHALANKLLVFIEEDRTRFLIA